MWSLWAAARSAIEIGPRPSKRCGQAHPRRVRDRDGDRSAVHTASVSTRWSCEHPAGDLDPRCVCRPTWAWTAIRNRQPNPSLCRFRLDRVSARNATRSSTTPKSSTRNASTSRCRDFATPTTSRRLATRIVAQCARESARNSRARHANHRGGSHAARWIDRTERHDVDRRRQAARLETGRPRSARARDAPRRARQRGGALLCIASRARDLARARQSVAARISRRGARLRAARGAGTRARRARSRRAARSRRGARDGRAVVLGGPRADARRDADDPSASGATTRAARTCARSSTRSRGTRRATSRPIDRSPDLRPRVVRFEVRPATFALLRQAQQVLADERGMHLDDDALVAAMCGAVLDGGGADDAHGPREVPDHDDRVRRRATTAGKKAPA